MADILVIRFGALGDLCVLGWSLAGLADNRGESAPRTTVVTKATFAPLAAEFTGVHEVIGLDDNSLAGVRQLAGQLKGRRWDAILDAHNTLRSRLLLALLQRRAEATLAKDTIARLGFMSFGRRHPRLERRMIDRFTDLTRMITPTAVAGPPLAHLRTAPPPRTPIVGLAPGARWDTKRWPAAGFAALATRLRRDGNVAVRVYLGPREAAWFPDSALARVCAADSSVSVVQVPDLVAVAGNLAEVSLLVTNDSGLLHLAESVGTPVLAFFGPTVREFGYFPLLPASRVLEEEVACRPCSRNGKRPCHRGDLVCLTAISPDQAWTAVQEMLRKDQS